MKLRTFAAAMATLALAVPALADTLKFNNTASKIEFVGRKKDGSHNGGFKKFAGTIDMADANFATAKVSLEIQAESLFTDNDKLSAHLKSPDFFDVRTYPKAKFVSTAIRTTSSDNGFTHFIIGDLTLHGVTKSLRIPVRVERTDTGLTLISKFTIQRKDFGMTYGEGMVNNDVAVTLTLQAGK